MKQYFSVDNKGKILETFFFEDDEISSIPIDLKRGWECAMQKPYWDFTSESWRDGFEETDKLKESKERKKMNLSESCQECILSGFESTFNNKTYHFSYDREAQTNLSERWQLFQNNMIESIVVTGHTLDGKLKRIVVDKEQFSVLYLDSVKHKENQISYLQDVLIPLVEETETVEELEEINWNMQLEETDKPIIEVKDDKLLSVLVNTNQKNQLLLETAVMDVAMQVYQ